MWATIGLSMIVKNEAHVIRRCLDSMHVEQFIDYYYVVDNGSTDGTQDIIREYFNKRGIKGEVVDYPFADEEDRLHHTEIRGIVDFRNMALEGLNGKVDYIFWIDADEELKFDPLFDFNVLKKKISEYDFAYFRCVDKGFMFRNNHMIRASLGWEWHGIAHEYLRTKKKWDLVPITIDGCTFIYNEDGSSWKNKDVKTNKYIRLLTKQHEEEPTEGRWLFYLAQSYRALETADGYKEAIRCFEERVKLFSDEGDESEVYVSKLLSLSLRQQLGEKISAKDFEECNKYDRSRIENLIIAAQLYWQYPAHESSYKLTSAAVKKFMKPPYGVSEMLVRLTDYTFSCAHMHAINCFYTKRKEEGLRVLDKLMESIKQKKSPSLVAHEELMKLKTALNSLN